MSLYVTYGLNWEISPSNQNYTEFDDDAVATNDIDEDENMHKTSSLCCYLHLQLTYWWGSQLLCVPHLLSLCPVYLK